MSSFKKYFNNFSGPLIFIFIFSILFSLNANTIFASSDTSNAIINPNYEILYEKGNLNKIDESSSLYERPLAGRAEQQAAASVAREEREKKEREKKLNENLEKSLSWWQYLNPANWIPIALQYIGNIILAFVSLFLALTGFLLNIVLDITVASMANTIDKLKVIDSAWGVIRDFANMLFIFILLYIAISTILGLTSVNTKKLLMNLILAAIFINFSLFFTKAIIDASNIIALGFYKQWPDLGIQDLGRIEKKDYSKTGGSNTIMNALSLSSLYGDLIEANATNPLRNLNPAQVAADNLSVPIRMFTAVIMGAVLIQVAAFVFLVAAILFIIRFVILIFLMILSPLMFASAILPQFSGLTKKWWQAFNEQILFAPAYMLLTLIAFRILQSDGFRSIVPKTSQDGQPLTLVQSLLNTGQTSMTIVVNYVIVMVFLLGAIVIAKKLGAWGADAAVNWGGKLTFGAAGYAGRQTIGRGAAAIKDSEMMKNLRRDNPMLGKLATKGLGKVAGSSFDARGINKDLSKNLNLGKPTGKGGYSADAEARLKAEKEYVSDTYMDDIEQGKRRKADANTALVNAKEREKAINDQAEENVDRNRDYDYLKVNIDDTQKLIDEAKLRRARAPTDTESAEIDSEVMDLEEKLANFENRRNTLITDERNRLANAVGTTMGNIVGDISNAQDELQRADEALSKSEKDKTDYASNLEGRNIAQRGIAGAWSKSENQQIAEEIRRMNKKVKGKKKASGDESVEDRIKKLARDIAEDEGTAEEPPASETS